MNTERVSERGGLATDGSMPAGPKLLIAAHPGHELRLYGWMVEHRPDVLLLTDGSGRSGRSRVDSSRHTLADAGATAGELFGEYSDRQFYDALLAPEISFFIGLARRLAEILCARPYVAVVADPLEGYNPVHDLCRMLADAALAHATRLSGRTILNFDYALMDGSPPELDAGSIKLTLDDALLDRKLKAAFAYHELADEISRSVGELGERGHANEWLRALPSAVLHSVPPQDPPAYESYGEQRCRDGHYFTVIRYRQHLLPVAAALSEWAGYSLGPTCARASA